MDPSKGKLQSLCTPERKNWLIHFLFNRQEYKDCLKLVEEMQKESDEKSEFLLFMKGLIFRIEGKIQESLEAFKQCHILNPNNVACQKEVAKDLYLLGKQNSAIEVYDAASNLSPNDWQIFYGKALCYSTMRCCEEAIKYAKMALNLHKHELMYF